MSDLMCDDVCLCKIAGRTELRLQIAIESEIDIHATIAGTVERADRRLGEAACGFDSAREQHQGGLLVFAAGLSEQRAPGFFRVSEHD